ncbi:hypothetical protein ACFE04_005574 [Oxalis oulophora]
MELLPKPFYGSMKRYWKRKQYEKLEDDNYNNKSITSRKTNVKTIGNKRRFWKIKTTPKLRLKKISSPMKLVWIKLKNFYVDAMLNLAGNVGYLNTENTFGSKRVPKGRQIQVKYSSEQIEERIVYEIYKAFVASRDLSTM